jgi:hypothetical protein
MGIGDDIMKHLWRRLRKIESALIDDSGCVPYSNEWFAYWYRQTERLLSGEPNVPKPPIAFLDAVLHAPPGARREQRPKAEASGARPIAERRSD